MLAILGFLIPWGVIFLHRRTEAIRGLIANWPLFLFPFLATLSTIWSEDPRWTLKAGIEIFATVVVGIVAGCCVRPRTIISALMSALLVVAVISLATMWQVLLADTGDAYLKGIFGSKNAFAAVMSLLLLTAIGVIIDKSQPKIFRFLGYAALILLPYPLYLAHSLGALLAVIMTMGIFALVLFVRRLSKGLRPVIYFSIVLIAVTFAVIPILTENGMAGVLTFLGKDATLTGRTFLWSHALQNISERPLLGTGYGAFWRLENLEAQILWYALHVPAGPGFNFHNEYLEVFVELGIVGCALCVGYLVIMTINAFKSINQSYSPEQAFAFILLVYYLIRTPVECGIFGQFNIGMVMFCILWIYLKPGVKEKSKAILPLHIYVPPSMKSQLQ